MRWMTNMAAVIALALACASAAADGAKPVQGAAQSSDPDDVVTAQDIPAFRKSADYNSRLAAKLAAENQPRSLAFAAALQMLGSFDTAVADSGSPPSASTHDTRALAWLRAADARAGEDVEANLLLAAIAEQAGDPSVKRAAATRWADAEPDNIAPLFFSGDPPEAILAATHTRRHFDTHWFGQIRWMSKAIARYPELSDPASLVQGGVHLDVEDMANSMALAMVSAYAIPPFQRVVHACRGPALASAPARRADCVALGEALSATSDIVIGQWVGCAILSNAAEDAATREQAMAFERRLKWQFWREAPSPGFDARNLAARTRRNLADPSIRTEQQAFERDLTEAHIPLDPPAGWKPTSP